MLSKEKKEECRRHNQAQWLQANLSEIDEKVQMIVSSVEEEEGESFAKRAEIYFKRRPQILRAIHDLHRSYRCLADHLLRRSMNSGITPQTLSCTGKDVSELMEDNLRQQSDLVQRNQSIKELRSEIKRLLDENRALKASISAYKSKRTLFHLAKLTGCSH